MRDARTGINLRSSKLNGVLLRFPEHALRQTENNLLSARATEKVGFEPTAPFGVTGFQDQLLKPLGHLSMSDTCKNRRGVFIGDPSEIRTPDTLIKSQVLCRLS